LPERQRTVFLLRFVEEMDYWRWHPLTGMKEAPVKAHLFSSARAEGTQAMGVTI